MREQPRSALAARAARGSVLALLFLTPIVFWPAALDRFGLPKAAVLWVFGLVSVAALLVAYAQGGAPVPRLRLGLPAAALLVAAGMATIFSIAPLVSLWGFYDRYNGFVTLALCEGLALVIATQYRRRPERLRDVAVALAASSALVTAYVIVQALKLDPIRWGNTPLANLEAEIAHAILPTATVGNPNFVGGTLAVALPFAISLGISATRTWRRAVWFAIGAFEVAAIGLTKSRGGVLGGTAGLAALAFIHRRSLRSLLTSAVRTGLLALGAITLVIGISAAVVSRTTPAELFSSSTLFSRWQYWQGAASVFVHNPVLGTGPDTFYAAFGRYRPARDGAAHGLDEAPPDKPHNIYLEYAAGTGILGLGAYLAVIALAIVYGIRRLRELDGLSRVLLGAFLAALAAYLAQAAVSIDTLPIPLIEWASIGAIAAIADPGRAFDRSRPASATRRSRGVAGVVGVAVFPLAALITNPLVADHTAKIGQRIGDAGDYAGSSRHFERAMTLDGREGTYPYLAGVAQENQAGVSSSRAGQGMFLRRAISLYGRALRRAPRQPFFQRAFARASTALAVNVDPSRFPAADRAWRACVDDDPNDWEVRAMHADMLAAWAKAGGGDQARARAVEELKRIASMPGLEKRARRDVARISTKLGLRRSPAG